MSGIRSAPSFRSRRRRLHESPDPNTQPGSIGIYIGTEFHPIEQFLPSPELPDDETPAASDTHHESATSLRTQPRIGVYVGSEFHPIEEWMSSHETSDQEEEEEEEEWQHSETQSSTDDSTASTESTESYGTMADRLRPRRSHPHSQTAALPFLCRETECLICYRESPCVIYQCGHQVTCSTCDRVLFTCPKCMAPIENRIFVRPEIISSTVVAPAPILVSASAASPSPIQSASPGRTTRKRVKRRA